MATADSLTTSTLRQMSTSWSPTIPPCDDDGTRTRSASTVRYHTKSVTSAYLSFMQMWITLHTSSSLNLCSDLPMAPMRSAVVSMSVFLVTSPRTILSAQYWMLESSCSMHPKIFPLCSATILGWDSRRKVSA